MKSVPNDDATLDALFQAIAGEQSLAAHISNASLPNDASSHDSEAIIKHYEANAEEYVAAVVRAGRRFRAGDKI